MGGAAAGTADEVARCVCGAPGFSAADVERMRTQLASHREAAFAARVLEAAAPVVRVGPRVRRAGESHHHVAQPVHLPGRA